MADDFIDCPHCSGLSYLGSSPGRMDSEGTCPNDCSHCNATGRVLCFDCREPAVALAYGHKSVYLCAKCGEQDTRDAAEWLRSKAELTAEERAWLAAYEGRRAA